MRVSFSKLSPTGNITILLRGEFSPTDRAAMCIKAIDVHHLHAEQAGVIRYEPVPRLDMMGNEFCLNGTRAFAALLAFEGKLEEQNGEFCGIVESSGAAEPLPVRVRIINENTAHAAVRVPMASPPVPEELDPGVWLVKLPGIWHLLLDAERHPIPLSTNRHLVPMDAELIHESSRWRQRYGLETQEAAGVVRFRREGRKLSIVPVVWVALTNSACVESACGSGSLSAVLLSAWLGPLDIQGLWQVEQAGGVLEIAPDPANTVTGIEAGIWVGGSVHRIADGEVFV